MIRTTEDSGYLLDNRRTEAGERSGALGQLFDGSTSRHLDRGFGELLAERGADPAANPHTGARRDQRIPGPPQAAVSYV
ncbi:hypothetical protein [Streptomyces sp. NPDC056682]|uniref:hypothetical protein n=1 Tax=Streptomyces sp. NPDC056682 TaxID=3345909 RepID=UPI00369A437A